MPASPELIAAFTVPASFLGSLIACAHYVTKWRTAKIKPGADVENRLARVEVAIDDMSAELTRMIESQQVVAKMLAEHATEVRHGT